MMADDPKAGRHSIGRFGIGEYGIEKFGVGKIGGGIHDCSGCIKQQLGSVAAMHFVFRIANLQFTFLANRHPGT